MALYVISSSGILELGMLYVWGGDREQSVSVAVAVVLLPPIIRAGVQVRRAVVPHCSVRIDHRDHSAIKYW